MAKTPTAPPKDELAAQLAQLGGELQAVANDELARTEKLREVEAVLGSIQVKDLPDLAESPIVQGLMQALGVADLRPGETRNKGTLAERTRNWSWGDIQAGVRSGEIALRRFVPAETIELIFNGLALRVIADQECEVPEMFYDIYRDRRRALGEAAKNEAWMLGKSTQAPHPDWQTPEGASVRAWSMQAEAVAGRPGGVLTTGPIRELSGMPDAAPQEATA
jgi:hypothetical protein